MNEEEVKILHDARRRMGDASAGGQVISFGTALSITLGVAMTAIATFTGYISSKVLEEDKLLAQHDVSLHQLADIAVRIDRHLESIDSRYEDVAIAVQALKGNEGTLTEEIVQLRAAADVDRAERLQATVDLSERVQAMEKVLAPMGRGR